MYINSISCATAMLASFIWLFFAYSTQDLHLLAGKLIKKKQLQL